MKTNKTSDTEIILRLNNVNDTKQKTKKGQPEEVEKKNTRKHKQHPQNRN